MILKEYQIEVIDLLRNFFMEAEKQKIAVEKLDDSLRSSISYVDIVYNKLGLSSRFADRPKNGLDEFYPRFCLKIPTGGGKTLIAIEAIREYQNLFVKKRTGLVVWITHREIIYRQTIEKLKDKSHIYRQWLDQCSGNKTIILEKGQPLRLQDTENNLVVLMLMMQSTGRNTKENMKVFQDSSGYIEFFPQDNQYDKHKKLLESIPNLDFISDNLFNHKIIKTSLGNAIRILKPLIIVDEFHTMFSDIAKATLDSLNPSMIIGLSATPKERRQMNVFVEITGRQLEREEMIKLDLHLHSPTISGNWHEMINEIKKKREILEKDAVRLNSNKGIYIRPIALIQAERTGKDQREKGKVHSEDIREYLIDQGVPAYEVAVKSSEIDEIRESRLLSESCEIRYIITKEALKEGWDCSFAYILGVVPNAKSESSMTQLVGRILRQPYAKKSGIKELDESYVYFTKGDTADVLKNIQIGFEQEGLGDLVQSISRDSGPTGSRKIKTQIKKAILNDYPESLYLPVWIIKEASGHRRFSYDIDIKPKIDWRNKNYSKWIKKEIFPLLDEKQTAYEILVDLENQEKIYLEETGNEAFEVSYLARRIADIVENAFISFDLASDFIGECKKYTDMEKLVANSGFITQEIIKKLEDEKIKQEQEIFNLLVKTNTLILTVCSDENVGYLLPEENEIFPEGIETYRLNLFEKSDILSMNSLEIKIAQLLDNKKNVLWWVRNITEGKKWYAISGWKRNKIHPDFIVAKKNNKDSLELVYIIESKGEHLIGNLDTQYKKSVFERINEEKIKPLNVRILKFEMNENFKFELVEQGKEDIDINRFFNL
ncbi:MAG: DEAD/DEAH box helicase [Thiobacillus sp.]